MAVDRASETRAFEALFRPHFGRLYNLALRLCRNPRDAEDLVQDCLLRAFRFLHHFDPETNARAWLYKILTNTFANRYRKESRERELLQAFRQHERVWDRAPTPPDLTFEHARFSYELESALDRLPSDFRLAVLLADVEELSYREIADIMACPIGTVMSRLARGRRMLKSQLSGSALDPAAEEASDQADADAGTDAGEGPTLRVLRGGRGTDHGGDDWVGRRTAEARGPLVGRPGGPRGKGKGSP